MRLSTCPPPPPCSSGAQTFISEAIFLAPALRRLRFKDANPVALVRPPSTAGRLWQIGKKKRNLHSGDALFSADSCQRNTALGHRLISNVRGSLACFQLPRVRSSQASAVRSFQRLPVVTLASHKTVTERKQNVPRVNATSAADVSGFSYVGPPLRAVRTNAPHNAHFCFVGWCKRGNKSYTTTSSACLRATKQKKVHAPVR